MLTTDHEAAPVYADIVDLQRYPIHQLDSDPGKRLIESCREDLRHSGLSHLDGFLLPKAVDQCVADATRMRGAAWATDKRHTVYFEPFDESVPEDDPRARGQRSAKKAIAYDCLPERSPIRMLYESNDMTRFIAAVLGKQVLYRSADPFDAVSIAMLEDGDELGWHFDRSEFAVTVLYQTSDSGGQYEYCPGLRSEVDENYPGVQRVLAGDTTNVRSSAGAPGTLAIFQGQHALHRVTPIRGERPRINSILSYGERPGMKLNSLTQELFYGRTA